MLAVEPAAFVLSDDSLTTTTLAERVLQSLRGRSLGWLERAAELPKGYGTYITKGQRKKLNPDMMGRLAKALEVDHHWLATGEGSPDVAEPPQPKTDIGGLAANQLESMNAYNWDGVPESEYDRVEAALVAEHGAAGRDRVPSWWTARIRELLREGRPLAKSVHQREPAEPPPDPDAPSPEFLEMQKKRAEAKAEREAAAKKGKKK